MTARLDVTPKTTEQNRIVRTGKSAAEITNNKKNCARSIVLTDTKHRAASLRQQSQLSAADSVANSNRHPVCDFLLVANSNVSHISYHFWNIAMKPSEIAGIIIAVSFNVRARSVWFHVNCRLKFGHKKTRVPSYRRRKLHSPTFSHW